MTGKRRPLRIALIALAAVVLVAVLAVGIAAWQFDPNAFKPQIEAAVKRATGRDLALNGKIGLALSLTPTIQVQDVAFSNPPGFSRPQMATLRSMELQLALLPLLSHRLHIDRLVLNQPDILLETNANGQPNWKLTPEGQGAPSNPSPSGSPQQTGTAGSGRTEVSVESIRIQDGAIAYRDGRTGTVTTLGLPRFDGRAASADAPLHVEADATYNTHPFNVIADTGSLARLQDSAATTPWPVKLALTAAGARLAMDGALTQPMAGKGYDLTLAATIPDTVALSPYLPNIKLPPLHDFSFGARIADSNGPVPAISGLTLHVGASDLSAQVKGLTLANLTLQAPSLTDPVRLGASGSFSGTPMNVAATLGAPAAFLPDAKAAPFAIDAAAEAAGSRLAVKGTIANIHVFTGVNLAVAAQSADLSALSPLAGRKLPPVKSVAFQAGLNDAAGGFRNGAALRDVILTSSAGDLKGNAALRLSGKPALTASLSSDRIDADALQAAQDQAAAEPPGSQAAKPLAKPADRRLFSDQPLPFDLLNKADADLTLAVGTLHSGGADYRNLKTHAVLKNGALAVDPLVGDLPAGHLQGTVSADASRPAPPVHLTLHAPGLSLRSVLQAAHVPSVANGNLEVYADLRGAGVSPHAIAASLDGNLGLALAGGTIDNRLLGSLLGKVMDSLNALDLVGKGGTSELRCFAVHAAAQNGQARIEPLVLASSLLTMTGSGSVNLGAETLALQLRPQARIGGTGLVIPLEVSGSIRNPSVGVNRLGAAESNAGTVAGAVIGSATPLGIVGGLLGADKVLDGKPGDVCAPALASARGQRVAESSSAPSARPAQPSRPDPAAALRNLFR